MFKAVSQTTALLPSESSSAALKSFKSTLELFRLFNLNNAYKSTLAIT